MNTTDSIQPADPLSPRADTRPRSMFVLADGRNVFTTFCLLVTLFTLWGFCTGLIDVMDKHFQNVLKLSLSDSAWVQFAHYLGYFVMALPAGWLATKLGYKGGIITGLLMVAVGGFWFIPATHIASFWAFLLGVCIIAAGLAFLETIANPYATVLGPPASAATRINLAQSCNGIGLLCGPFVGSYFFYSKDASGVSTGAAQLWIPYFILAIVVIVLSGVFYFANVPDIKAEDDFHHDEEAPGVAAQTKPAGAGFAFLDRANSTLYVGGFGFDLAIWKRPHFSLAVAAQFIYVGAQAGIFSFFVNYMTSETPAVPEAWQTGAHATWFEMHKNGLPGFSDAGAAKMASLGFFCFLAGRFAGTGILKKVAAHTTLGIFAALAAVLSLVVFCKAGWVSVGCVFLIYFFMSIMFPTIFALGIFGLGTGAKQAASFIVMAIIGGSLLPKLMGKMADKFDLSRGFAVPMVCFALIAAYAFLWPRLSGEEAVRGLSASGGH